MYIAYITQQADGCDYSIGCGQDMLELKALTYSDAITELKQEIIGKWDPEEGEYDEGYWGDRKIKAIRLIEVSDIDQELPIQEWYDKAQNDTNLQRNKKKTKAERKEYERLKALYDD